MPPYAFTARFIGSYPDGWLFVAFGHAVSYAVLNLSTRVKVKVANSLVWSAFPLGKPMVLRAATLSGSPANKAACVVGAICTTVHPTYLCHTFLAFSRLGASFFSDVTDVDVEDVIYAGQPFFCLARSGDVIVCTPEFNEASHPNYSLQVPQRHDEDVRVKGGEIMMVARYASILSGLTSSFAMFCMSPYDCSSIHYS
jgi:hypothetical protein